MDISLATELRHLPHHLKAKVAQLMDNKDRHWLEIMAAIPQSPPWYPGMDLPPEGTRYPRKYSAQECRLLENAVAGGHLNTLSNGIHLLMEEWGCSGIIRPTILDLLNLLLRAKLLTAVSFIRQEILQEASFSHHTEVLTELDELLSSSDKSTVKIRSSAVGANNEELDHLLREHNSQNSIPESCFKSTVVPEFTEGIAPHVSYHLLESSTDNFSNKPHSEGGYKLGEGAFGVVYRATLPGSAFRSCSDNLWHELAIKKLSVIDERTDIQFKLEVEVLSKCKNQNILEIIGYSCNGPSMCLLYEYMVNGNLQDRLSVSNDTYLSWEQRVLIIYGTAAGIAHLHTFMEVPMVHRDIKSANILLDKNFKPKLGDFGLVRMGGKGMHTKTQQKTTTVFGTSAYMAPEAFRGDVSVKLDTFSFGVVMLEVLTGLPVYDEDREGRDLLSYIEGLDTRVEDLRDKKCEPWPEGLAVQISNVSMKCVEEKKNRKTMVETLEFCEEIINKWN